MNHQAVKFYCEAKASIPLPPVYTFPQAFNYLNSHNNSFYILEIDGLGYVQCAGDKKKCAVEFRSTDNQHYRFAKGPLVAKRRNIEMSNGVIIVRSDETLTHNDAIAIFESFFHDAKFPSHFRMNLLDTGYKSTTAQQVDAPDPGSNANPA